VGVPFPFKKLTAVVFHYWAGAQSYFVRMRKKSFSVVFCVIRGVHKFDFRLVINEKKSRSYGDRHSCFYKVCMFYPASRFEC
jgi:hypothetical protein